MKKLAVLSLSLLFALPGFAKGLSAAETNAKALEILIDSASAITLEGDVRSDEKLSAILSRAMISAGQGAATIKNNCIFVSYDGIFECHLDIQHLIDGVSYGETVISYETFADKDGAPDKMLINKVRVSRGH
ncbi:hypothetical protein [Bdellovibrio bacteriovorus]|uniref:Uncharacterized protein n=1 Tax=Bdellovibrio bacteriovorus str. Tiberius TaxID=1069642 RepID=K7YZC3_BDEBC|nr:hypothetical protein [Bdellovibrio bacteriovorus]AFY02055.1 hypothetical protein Bdt_2372 [Bdellovibrio bacteriovorus str. Tiberius]